MIHKVWTFLLLFINISPFVTSSQFDIKPKTNTKGNQIFEYAEEKVLNFPITPFGSLDTTLVRSLVIDYPEYTLKNVSPTFDLNDFSNMYQGYDNTYIRKLMNLQNGDTDDIIDYYIEDDTVGCPEFDDICIFDRAKHLLNKVNSTSTEKKEALNLLEKVESTVPDSLFLLGVLYENYGIFFDEESTEQDKLERNLKSLLYYKQCAEQGDSKCQLVMAHKHLLGQDVPKDISKANLLQYSVINKEIHEAEKSSRFPWSMNEHRKNLWNHNYYKFLHDPDYKGLDYVEKDSDQKSILDDSKISLPGLTSNEFLADYELIDTMVALKDLHKMKYSINEKGSSSESSEKQAMLNLFFSNDKEEIKEFYQTDELEYFTSDAIDFLYADLVNSYKGNMFSSFKDFQYVFEHSKKLLVFYIENQEFIDKTTTKLTKYYIKEILLMFANIYKEYGVYDKSNSEVIDILFSIYKKVNAMSPKSGAIWESFKLLTYIQPHISIHDVHKYCLNEYSPEGYSRWSSTLYMLDNDISELYKEKGFDEALRTNVDLHRILQSGSSYLPLLYHSVNLGFKISTEKQMTDQSVASSKLRRILNSMQMKCNIDIFKQNFVNVMNYLLKNDQELNLFAMAQLSSMGYVSAINNLANELINPIKIFNEVDANLTPERLEIGISQYLTSYKLGNLNQGLHLSKIFERFEMYSEMLSLNHLISESDGTFYSSYNLAKIYEYGYGVEQDYDMAAKYYKKAFDGESIQFFHNSYKNVDGLEVSIRILLWKLKCKKIIDNIGLSFLANKILQKVLNVTSKANGKISNFDSIKLSLASIYITSEKILEERPLEVTAVFVMLYGTVWFFLPTIKDYLSRRFNNEVDENNADAINEVLLEPDNFE